MNICSKAPGWGGLSEYGSEKGLPRIFCHEATLCSLFSLKRPIN